MNVLCETLRDGAATTIRRMFEEMVKPQHTYISEQIFMNARSYCTTIFHFTGQIILTVLFEIHLHVAAVSTLHILRFFGNIISATPNRQARQQYKNGNRHRLVGKSEVNHFDQANHFSFKPTKKNRTFR